MSPDSAAGPLLRTERPLVLFDIDGTMLRSGGAGRMAMVMAGATVFGRPELFEGAMFAGAIDPCIVGRALHRAGIPPTPRRIGRVKAAYVRALHRTLHIRTGSACPGVRQALAAVAQRAEIGLLTGNWREGAELKLDRYGLWAPFAAHPPVLGAFGEDAPTRDGLVPVAVARARRRGIEPRRVLVVGDTPADVRCARAGARATGLEVLAVAVRTGFARKSALEAALPDLILDDLESGLPDLLALL